MLLYLDSEENAIDLAKGAMKDEGIFPLDLLNEIWDLIGKGATGVVQRPSYMPIVTPLIVPDKPINIILRFNQN